MDHELEGEGLMLTRVGAVVVGTLIAVMLLAFLVASLATHHPSHPIGPTTPSQSR